MTLRTRMAFMVILLLLGCVFAAPFYQTAVLSQDTPTTTATTTYIFPSPRKSSAISIRLNGSRVENIDGSDPLLNPMMTPLADPNLRAGTRADLLTAMPDLRDGLLHYGPPARHCLTRRETEDLMATLRRHGWPPSILALTVVQVSWVTTRP